MLQNNRTAALLELVRLKKSVRTCGLRTHFLETRRRIGPKSNRCPLRSPDEVPPKYYYERKEALQTPSSVTFSGPKEAVTVLHETLIGDGVRSDAPYCRDVSIFPDGAPKGGDVFIRYREFGRKQRTRSNVCMEIMLKPVRFAGALRKLVTASKSEAPLSTKFSSIIKMGSSTTSQGPIKQVFGQIDGRLVEKVPYALSWQLVRMLGKRRLRWQVFSGLPAIHSIWTK
ncbi:hypothetical protein AKAW_11083 [Aspergillus luchuensis IFO 4308]|nr:hypothetical protein AKAW_11083 [Aspergillus luchuensis IFO 4308]